MNRVVWLVPLAVVSGAALWWLGRDDATGADNTSPPKLAAPGASPHDAAMALQGWQPDPTDTAARDAEVEPLVPQPAAAPLRASDPRAAGAADEESSTRQAARQLATQVAARLGLEGVDAADLGDLMADAAERRKSLGRAAAEAGHDIEARMQAGKAMEAETRAQRAALAERFGDDFAQQILIALARGR